MELWKVVNIRELCEQYDLFKEVVEENTQLKIEKYNAQCDVELQGLLKEVERLRIEKMGLIYKTMGIGVEERGK